MHKTAKLLINSNGKERVERCKAANGKTATNIKYTKQMLQVLIVKLKVSARALFPFGMRECQSRAESPRQSLTTRHNLTEESKNNGPKKRKNKFVEF